MSDLPHPSSLPVDQLSMHAAALVSIETSEPTTRRPSPQSLLRAVLERSSEVAVAAELRVSLQTLHRFLGARPRMSWVTYTRLAILAAELTDHPDALREQAAPPHRARPTVSKRRERRSGSFPAVVAPAAVG